MSSPPPTPPSPNPSQATYVLGQTGQTIVYVFPSGDALLNRSSATAPALLNAYQRQRPQPPTSPLGLTTPPAAEDAALIDEWLAAGQLTMAQIQVAQHDRAATGMSLVESLMLRGWL